MIFMDSKAQLTVDIISKVAQGKVSILNASKLLNKSRRTIERYLKQYQQVGIQFIVHRYTGRVPANKAPDCLKRQVQSLIKEKYYDVNLQHLAELLATHEGIQIKRETLLHWAHDIHHVKRAKRRRARVRKKRERMESAGLLLQMDGSTHRWFGNEKSCLIAIIYDATSEVHAEFFKSETTQGCLKVNITQNANGYYQNGNGLRNVQIFDWNWVSHLSTITFPITPEQASAACIDSKNILYFTFGYIRNN